MTGGALVSRFEDSSFNQMLLRPDFDFCAENSIKPGPFARTACKDIKDAPSVTDENTCPIIVTSIMIVGREE